MLKFFTLLLVAMGLVGFGRLSCHTDDVDLRQIINAIKVKGRSFSILSLVSVESKSVSAEKKVVEAEKNSHPLRTKSFKKTHIFGWTLLNRVGYPYWPYQLPFKPTIDVKGELS